MSEQSQRCKNLTAAHIACPNFRNSSKGGSYCDSCRDAIQPTGARKCRNAASSYFSLKATGSFVGCPHGGQTGAYGFCKHCSGQAALPLCVNYTNARVRCGKSLPSDASRNEVSCNDCLSSIHVPNQQARLCKNAASNDDPCSNVSVPWLVNEYHGMCSSCAQTQKALLADESGDPSLCRTLDCTQPFELPLSRYCRQCILKKKDLHIDVREKHLVLEIETSEAAAKKKRLCKRFL